MTPPRILCLLLSLAAPLPLFAQGSAADYQRALELPRSVTGKVFKANLEPHWIEGRPAMWYRNELPGGRREFFFVDTQTGQRRPAFDSTRLAALLSEASGNQVPADRLPFTTIEVTKAGAVRFRHAKRNWEFNPEAGTLTPTDSAVGGEPLKSSMRQHPSRSNTEETSVTFVNRTDGEVQCFWISTENERRPYQKLKAGESFEQHTFVGHVWMVRDSKDELIGVWEAKPGGGDAVIERGDASDKQDATPAPVANKPRDLRKWSTFVRDQNLWLRSRDNGEEIKLTSDGTSDEAYSDRVEWAPDGVHFLGLRVKRGDQRKVHLIESSPKDQLQPKLIELDYPKPGDQLAIEQPYLFDAQARSQVRVPNDLFQNPWDLSQFHWAPDSSECYFLFNQRGHQVLRVLAANAATGAVRSVVEETSPTFIDYSQKTFLQWLDATGELIWMSERDGWNHLWLYDLKTGQVKNQITRGSWVVRGVERVDVEKRRVWFKAGGIRPDQDPYYQHLARVNFDGSGLVVLTEADGTHRWTFSPDGRTFVDTWSRVDQPPVTELRSAEDGRLLCKLEEADASALFDSGWKRTERFVAPGRDGVTPIYGNIYRPTNFTPDRKYPVIEQIYAGPHGAFVPKAWSTEVGQRTMAELGFIVVQIDGMGTNWRSRAFHDVAWKNVADAGFPDRITWMKAAAAAHPEMDITRVGIYGGSAGGQNALGALLFHGEFYKAAAADCGCHDNRMDKIWWNEAWMGWPVGPEYAANSNVTHAHQLTGKLFLTVGELDRNVDPSSTMQVVNALIKADKDFEFLIVPGAGHGIGESPYAARRRMDFFVRNLLGVEPRHP